MTVTIDYGRQATYTGADQNLIIRHSFGARVWQDRRQIVVRFSNGYRTRIRGSQDIPQLVVTVPEGYWPIVIPAGCRWVGNQLTIPPMVYPARTPRTFRFLNGLAPTPVAFAMPTGMKQVTGLEIETAANRARVVENAIVTGWIADEITQIRPGAGWNPAGGHEGDTQGGIGIEPSPGVGLSWRLHAHLGDAWRQRSDVDDLDPATGEPLRASRVVDLQDAGKNDGPDWPTVGIDGPLPAEWSRWRRKDGEHLVREVRHDVAMAFLWRDPCAMLNLRVSARRVMDAITLDDMRATIAAARNPDAEVPSMGRIHGWAAYTVGACALAHGRDAGAYRDWLAAIVELYRVSQVSGLFQHEGPERPGRPGYAYWAPNPKGVVPESARIAQSHEHGILICGMHVAMRALGGYDDFAMDSLGRAAGVWFGANAAPFRKWPSTSGHSYGEPESLYLDWAASFCDRWHHAEYGAKDLLRVRGIATPDAWLDRWAHNDDGLLHLRIDAVYMFGRIAGRW